MRPNTIYFMFFEITRMVIFWGEYQEVYLIMTPYYSLIGHIYVLLYEFNICAPSVSFYI